MDPRNPNKSHKRSLEGPKFDEQRKTSCPPEQQQEEQRSEQSKRSFERRPRPEQMDWSNRRYVVRKRASREALDRPAKMIRNNKVLMGQADDERKSREAVKREKSRISAKECRERMKLRRRYLKDFVDDTENKVIKLRLELDHLVLWARNLMNGVMDPELIKYRFQVEQKFSSEMFLKNATATEKNTVSEDMAPASGSLPGTHEETEVCCAIKTKSRRRCKAAGNTKLPPPSFSEILEPQECVKQEFKEVAGCDMKKNEDLLTLNKDAQESSVISYAESLNNSNLMSFPDVAAYVSIPYSAQDQASVWEIESVIEDFGEGETKETYCSLVLLGDA